LSDSTGRSQIALRDVSPRPHAHPVEPPYQLFLGTALGLALLGGFMLAVLLPVARAFEWDWGNRWQELAQAHGQLQLLGFAGLFISGMALRLMPRFSGRPLAYPDLARSVVALTASGVILRAVAPLFDNGAAHTAAFIGGSVLLLAGSVAFAAVILRTLVHRDSKAEATGWFFVLGALGSMAAATLSLVLAVRAVDGDQRLLPLAENNALVSYQLYGFVLLFVGGVATRAVATLVGRQRSQIAARVAASGLAVAAAAHACITLITAYDAPTSRVRDDAANIALAAVAVSLLLIVWASGVFHPRANRVAPASQAQFWFVRAACAWLAGSALLLGWYAVQALSDGAALDQYEIDAVRHLLTVGVVTMIIMGMAMLVVPEFAGRRLQHPGETWLVRSMFAAVNIAAALRAWPALEGIDWLSSSRYWPMAGAGGLAIAAIGVFAFMFGQSYFEQRRQGWASPEALGARARG
jgi:hypothetical protein